MIITSTAAIALALSVSAASPVVGSWTLLGQPFATFNANGTCSMDGEACTWRADKGTLFITGDGETDAVPFSIAGAVMTVTVGGFPMQLVRAGKAPPAAAAPPPAAAPPATAAAPKAAKGAKIDPNDPTAKLLLSSPWCTFHYNKTTGYSSSTRVQYFADGTYQLGGRSEGYSSGSGGTFASQHDTGSTGKWFVKGGILHATAPPTDAMPVQTEFWPLPFTVARNSNGFPIITGSDGKEYSQCQ